MAANLIIGFLKLLYGNLRLEYEVWQTQKEILEAVREADPFLDVERLTCVSLEEQQTHVSGARAAYDQTAFEIRGVREAWSQLPADERRDIPLPEAPPCPHSTPPPTSPPTSSSRNQNPGCRPPPPSLSDPAVGTVARPPRAPSLLVPRPAPRRPPRLRPRRPANT